MTLNKILEAIEQLAMEDMTEDGIHHDSFPDYQGDYEREILERLTEVINN